MLVVCAKDGKKWEFDLQMYEWTFSNDNYFMVEEKHSCKKVFILHPDLFAYLEVVE